MNIQKSTALSTLSRGIQNASSVFPVGNPIGKATPQHLSRFISPIQFERLAHDIKMWRDAIVEMEAAYFPMRVKAQRMFMDTVENGTVKSLIERYKDLTLLRDYTVYQIKDGKKIQSDVLTQAVSEQSWFADYVEYILEALLYGYSLIELGDIVNDGFPDISVLRRENIRPDGYANSGALVTSFVYAIDGVHVEKGDPLITMSNHWIGTKSNRGVSKCGYGLLYNCALYEIHLRHVLEWNMDFVEGFGMPIKKGFTRKQGDAKAAFEQFLSSGASNQWVLLDKATDDDVVYEFAANIGTAWKAYDNVETRLESVLSKLILGHEDAIRSLPGKLGGMQAANKDGFNESLVEQAMNDKQTKVGNFVCRKVNEIGAPAFRSLGKYVGSGVISKLIPEGYYFGLLNDKEEAEIRRRRNAQNLVESEVALNLFKAGYKRDAKELGEWMSMTLESDNGDSFDPVIEGEGKSQIKDITKSQIKSQNNE